MSARSARWAIPNGNSPSSSRWRYLVATGMWFDGAQLYRDIAENNPPLSFYLTATAVLMSRVIPIAPT
ncbi:MAG: hypothetical protein ACT6S1_22400 [Blastomonas fulva]